MSHLYTSSQNLKEISPQAADMYQQIQNTHPLVNAEQKITARQDGATQM
jgi:hypothetical protein